MRYLIDTHIFIWYAKERENLSDDVLALFDDYSNEFLVCSETLKELVQLWHKKPHIHKWWKSPLELIRSIEDEYHFHIDYLHQEHYEAYAKLQTNEAQEHNDPSDHLIISHAITNRIPLISADTRFPWYTRQGLELVFNEK